MCKTKCDSKPFVFCTLFHDWHNGKDWRAISQSIICIFDISLSNWNYKKALLILTCKWTFSLKWRMLWIVTNSTTVVCSNVDSSVICSSIAFVSRQHIRLNRYDSLLILFSNVWKRCTEKWSQHFIMRNRKNIYSFVHRNALLLISH